MSDAPFRAHLPLNSMSCTCDRREVNTNAGPLEYQTVLLPDEDKRVMLPTKFISPEGTGSLEITENSVRILLRSGDRTIVLSSEGLFLGEGAPEDLREATRGLAREITQQLVEDGGFKRAFLSLARGYWSSTIEAAAATESTPPPAVQRQVQAISQSYATMTKPVTIQVCRTDQIVETIEREVWGWVESVKTAAAQAKECHDSCYANYSGWAWVKCEAKCVAQLFVNLVTRTWQLIGKTVETIIKEITHCWEVAVSGSPNFELNISDDQSTIPSSVGRIHSVEVLGSPTLQAAIPIRPSGVSPQAIQSAFVPFIPAITCLAKGKWSVWSLDIPDVGPLEELPVGLRVCLDKECLDTILGSLNVTNLGATASVLGAIIAAGGAEAAAATILAALPAAVATAVNAVAVALGITVGLALAAIVVVLILIAWNVTAIAGQVWVQKLLGKDFSNGACLVHPLFALGAVGVATGPTVVGPLLAAQLAVNIPLIVEPPR